jgi:phosphohistidine phosphatase
MYLDLFSRRRSRDMLARSGRLLDTGVCVVMHVAHPLQRSVFPACRFKYILARVVYDDDAESIDCERLLVRGDATAEYHADILDQLKRELGRHAQVQALGGGRISHDAAQGKVHVFGCSMAFGPAVHEVSAALVQRAYPWYRAEDVTVGYEGY